MKLGIVQTKEFAHLEIYDLFKMLKSDGGIYDGIICKTVKRIVGMVWYCVYDSTPEWAWRDKKREKNGYQKYRPKDISKNVCYTFLLPTAWHTQHESTLRCQQQEKHHIILGHCR